MLKIARYGLLMSLTAFVPEVYASVDVIPAVQKARATGEELPWIGSETMPNGRQFLIRAFEAQHSKDYASAQTLLAQAVAAEEPMAIMTQYLMIKEGGLNHDPNPQAADAFLEAWVSKGNRQAIIIRLESALEKLRKTSGTPSQEDFGRISQLDALLTKSSPLLNLFVRSGLMYENAGSFEEWECARHQRLHGLHQVFSEIAHQQSGIVRWNPPSHFPSVKLACLRDYGFNSMEAQSQAWDDVKARMDTQIRITTRDELTQELKTARNLIEEMQKKDAKLNYSISNIDDEVAMHLIQEDGYCMMLQRYVPRNASGIWHQETDGFVWSTQSTQPDTFEMIRTSRNFSVILNTWIQLPRSWARSYTSNLLLEQKLFELKPDDFVIAATIRDILSGHLHYTEKGRASVAYRFARLMKSAGTL